MTHRSCDIRNLSEMRDDILLTLAMDMDMETGAPYYTMVYVFKRGRTHTCYFLIHVSISYDSITFNKIHMPGIGGLL